MLKKICNAFIGVIIVCLLIIASALLLPGLFGYQSFAVISGSMEPGIPVGSIVYAKEVPFDDLKTGDIISFTVSGNTKVTHRIQGIDKEHQSFTTKGDANNVEDGDPVSYQNVIGKVALSIPFLGYLSVYIKTPIGIAVACGVVFVLLILNFLPEVVEKDKKKE
ncbi:signal peptidase I [[Eubacterium] hominis]|uniref:signal peptidase I n=1 Tax=[Eubacterium] hominis TaxID=2764325 RepID=UPI003A4DD307